MDFKRVTSALLGLPLVLIVLIFANKYIVDVVFTIIAILSMNEYFNAISKDSKPVKWVGFVACLSIAFIHLIPTEYIGMIGIIAIPTIFLLLFLKVIISKMNTNFKDVAFSFMGICYIVLPLICLSLIRGLDDGKILIWYAFFAAWGTDVFAYIVGKYLGKHRFTEISPKKTIEGCIGGLFGASIVILTYTYFINTYLQMDYSYILIGIFAIIFSLIGQVGDLAASTVKRYVNIKDYSELIPGHGGMLDRIDSLLFIAPFAYILSNFI